MAANSAAIAPRKNRTLEQGLEILSLFSMEAPELTALEIQEQLAIPTSTLYRLLQSVKANSWIEEDGTGKYRLGLRILELARVVRARLSIIDVARGEMAELSKVTRETVLLTALSGDQAVCIDHVEGQQAVRVSMERGVVMPLHAGASSVVLLAFLEEARRNAIVYAGPLKRYTDNTITDPAELCRRLDRFRAQGFVFSDQEVDVGVRGIGAPILDERLQVVAGLSLVAPRERMTDAQIPELGSLVKAAAARISEMTPRRK
jgi:DNA-binding IclR family transcriptional regulator